MQIFSVTYGKFTAMEEINESYKGKVFSDSAHEDAQNKLKIANLDSFIVKCYGNDIVEYFNNHIRNKKQGKRMTIEEYAKMLKEDEYLQIILACINQRTLRRFHYWIWFGITITFIGIIIYLIIVIKASSASPF